MHPLHANPELRARLFLPLLSALFFICPGCYRETGSKKHINRLYQEWLGKSEHYSNSVPDSSLRYSDMLLSLPEVNNNDSLLIPVLVNRALAFRVQDKRDSSLSVISKLRTICQRTHDTANWSRTENITAAVFADIGQNNLAIKHAGIAYTLAETAGLRLHAARALLKIGSAHIENNAFVASLLHFQKAYLIFRDLDSLAHISEVSSLMAYNYNMLGKWDSAVLYGLIGVQCAEDYGMNNVRGMAYNNMGLLYQKNHPDEALVWYRKSYALNPTGLVPRMNLVSAYIQLGALNKAQQILDSLMLDSRNSETWTGVARCHQQYARLFEEKGDLSSAIKSLEQAIHIGDSIGIGYVSMGARETLKQIYRKTGRLQEAGVLEKFLNHASDSLNKLEQMQALQVVNQYNAAERQQQHHLQNLKNKVRSHETLNIRNKQIMWLLFIALLLLTLGFYRIRKYYRQRNSYYERMLTKYAEDAEQLRLQLQNATPLTLFARLVQFLEEEKPWLDPNLKMDDLAAMIGSNRKTLAAELKKEQIPGLTNLVQRYRVEAAIAMMKNPLYRSHKLQAISEACGFGSHRTFQHVFEQVTGLTPVQYRNNLDKS